MSEDQNANATPKLDGRRRKTPAKVRDVAAPKSHHKRKEKPPFIPPIIEVDQDDKNTRLQKDSQFPGKKVTNSRVLKVVRKNLNALKEIAGRKGCGPLDYTQWARLFRMEISLLDLL